MHLLESTFHDADTVRYKIEYKKERLCFGKETMRRGHSQSH